MTFDSILDKLLDAKASAMKMDRARLRVHIFELGSRGYNDEALEKLSLSVPAEWPGVLSRLDALIAARRAQF